MNTSVFLNNVVISLWQIITPIIVVVFIVASYKFSRFFREHLLFIYTLALTVFVPLYPKIPLEGIRNTFVYIRLDDIFVAIGIVLWIFYLLKGKITWKSPLSIPIITYWIVGFISTIIAIIFIFPNLLNVHPATAIFFFLRHIEYLMLFFLAFSSMKRKEYIPWLVFILVFTTFIVAIYGIGQRFFPAHFLAFSTMNEEFAKGTPLILSAAGRIQSTFAGHYDLAAYLVMMIPLIGSLIFGFKNIFIKGSFFVTVVLSLIVLLMTASRTSFAVYLAAICFMLFLQKKKWFIVPVIILSLLLLHEFTGISNRFTSTLTSVPLAVDANTGKPIGEVSTDQNGKIVIVDKQSTGENLPQGSGYIVPVSSQQQGVNQIIFRRTQLTAGTQSAEITNLKGNFVIKQAIAYDVSFTTRFQGEWPRAMNAFYREPLFGSGYSSISLASDNNYLRMLGETGLLGFLSFLFIFIIASIFAYRVLPSVTTPLARSFIIGTIAAIFGLALNAILIDVFEASKVAYVLWSLLGFSIGILVLYQKTKINYLQELRILYSIPAIFIYFLLATFTFFSITLSNFFVGDDFTWLRWVADCKKVLIHSINTCVPIKTTFMNYFLNADGFFYRPAMKIYFYYMYSFSGLNPVTYHIFSLLLHWGCTILIFIISLRILKNKLFAVIAAFFFLILSSHEETLLWISSSNHLFVAFFMLLAVVLYDLYRQKKNSILLLLSVLCCFIAPLFHESGIVASLLVIAYAIVTFKYESTEKFKNILSYVLLLIPIPMYLFLRTVAKSIWGTGDYSYRLTKLPFNFFGNLIGYFLVSILGIYFEQYYSHFRELGKSHLLIVGLIIMLTFILMWFIFMYLKNNVNKEDKRIILYSMIFFIIPLLPFLGLGNMTARYSYVASFGVVLLLSYILLRIFIYLQKKNYTIAYLVIFFFVVGFSYFQYYQILRVNNDWVRAGTVTNNLLKNLSLEYSLPGTLPSDPVFYFSKVPSRIGYAWVLPNGLSDAIWLTFQDSNVHVIQSSSLISSMKQGEGSTSARFYEFDNSSNIIEEQPTVIVITPTPKQHVK